MSESSLGSSSKEGRKADGTPHSRLHPEIDISREGLSHLESPEGDEALRKKLSQNIDEFFLAIPLPENPMAAALAPTPEEVEENLAGEALKEAVREAYWRRVEAGRTEEARIATAMKRRFPHLSPSTSSIQKTSNRPDSQMEDKKAKPCRTNSVNDLSASTSSSQAAFTSSRNSFGKEECGERSILQELETMRARVRELEEHLAAKKNNNKP